ncbi:TonB-dependent receptor-like protein [Pedobacter psychrotolerans]|uniref:Collagen-binding protein n=1 Tax=Pedobacter psychrotolerans TaxID=1843235 RepID=A0A4R2HIN4_9SPHI|nr:TonB-dependent receptor [Pedobacter psychrotolerans]TCO29082.1 TonB-dependent receptor-like protein [Pedobacter psychrotolerans]GGE54023.1 collagen-binding protein [Pedobacter psychrotolerans]
MSIKFYLPIILLLLFSFSVSAQNKFTLSGTIRDGSSGETLIGATVKISGPANAGTLTNNYGYFALTQTEGTYTVTISYTGFVPITKSINLNKDTKLNEELKSTNDLAEVTVNANNRKNENVKSAQMGLERIDMKSLNSIPVLLGEKDVLKTIQLLPGVKSGGEGNTGFYVRGGAADQNLIILDEAVVYNSSHLLGFFSTFNADAIKDVSLYKGGMPAQYGGRLSSVLDVKMDDGNNKEFKFQGGIGLIASRLKAEGPIVKDRGSFMVSFRRTYIDLFLRASPDSSINGSTLNFYDINAKANYKINDKNTIYISGYFGKDNIGVKDLFENNWGNVTTTIRLNHIFNDRLFSNTSLIYNNYNYTVKLLNDVTNFKATSLVRDFNFKEDFQYFSNQHTLRFGLNATHHRISPIDITTTSEESQVNPLAQEKRYGLESAAYVSDEWAVNDKLNFLYGVRLAAFSLLGPGNFSEYDAEGNINQTDQVSNGKFYKNYFNLEPRFSVSYLFNERNSVKASYNRNTQNIHILTNATSSSPTDQYVLSSNNIKPEIADQVALGYFKNLDENNYELSGEVYYKWMQNQIDYKNAAQLLANSNVESELLYGTGRAYGLELFFKKKFGKLNGWVGYTLSRTERKFAQLNNGNYFPARQDRTHDVSVVGIYNLNQRWTFSSSFIYSTGNAVTFPAGKYVVGGQTVYYYTERNAGRMPYNMRLDLSATLEGKRKGRFQSSWNFGVYNALNRKNPYSIEFINDPNEPGKTAAEQTSLFGIIPSITWNFKF